ncbi:type II toxin-antitoxin system RelE/ParE family toxin [Caenispirillum salinarum]|uniref:type II toxin-antitoxin system RelE/ParE family toxin n=1 Tax=Caenispirillum salinarum TaxID=859058 RepID=UPI0005BBA3D6|nr:type II toxin-antitoxin system RelE/ParE family toxin [Caenispirillum salinarum]
MTVRLSPSALNDLDDILSHTWRAFGEDQALRYKQGLDATLDVLDQAPRIARERLDVDPPVRLHPYRRHVIVYRIIDDGILVVRLLHARQDWLSALYSEED